MGGATGEAEDKILAQKRILEMIATGVSLAETLDAIALFIEDHEPGALAAFLVVSPDRQRFQFSRGPSLPEAFHKAIAGLSILPPFIGSCAETVARCKPVVVPDVAADTTYAPFWRQALLSLGHKSLRSTPITDPHGVALASCALFYREARDPTPADPDLLDVATHLAAIALGRAQTEASLREREERLRLIINSAREYAIITTDLDGRITSWNGGAERILGFEEAEIVSHPFDLLFTPEDRAAGIPAREIARALAEGLALNERWHLRRDGTRFYASGITSVLENGRRHGLLVIFRDHTGEHRLTEEIDRRNAEFQAVLSAAPIAVWFTHDPEGRQVSGNRLATDWLGLPPGVNASFLASAHERSRAAIFRDGQRLDVRELPLHRALRGEEVHAATKQIEAPDGNRRDVLFNAVPLRDVAGAVIGAVSTATDITAQVETERKLRDLTATLEQRVADALAERKLLADIVEGTNVFVQVADLDYRWLAINKASADEFERIFGVRPRVGASMLDVLATQPEHQAAVKAVWSRALAGEEFVQTNEFGDPGRARRFYEMKFNTLRDPEGRRIGAYQFVYDVTERELSQRQLAETQAQLHEMQKMEAIGQLTGGIAHDFNNLLTPIYGALEMLQGRHRPEERLGRLISGALQSAERARVLVGRLLTFARRQHLEARPVSVASLVRGMGELIDRSLGPLIHVGFELPEDLPAAMVDPNQLELALLNLCVNARDAMPGGGQLRIAVQKCEVTVGHVPGLQAGSYIRLAVADTGTGMDAETLRRAVEPFYTTKGAGRGTGLGLSMVHGLAAQSGGMLHLDSAPGRGTTAAIYLPLAQAAAERITEPEIEVAALTRKLTVLLVDDEELVRVGLTDILEGLGHTVIPAASGAAALAQLHAEPDIEIIITDYMMPGMTGGALVREARRIRPGLPALLMTGYSNLNVSDANNILRLSKPFGSGDLARMIRAALNEKGIVQLVPKSQQ